MSVEAAPVAPLSVKWFEALHIPAERANAYVEGCQSHNVVSAKDLEVNLRGPWFPKLVTVAGDRGKIKMFFKPGIQFCSTPIANLPTQHDVPYCEQGGFQCSCFALACVARAPDFVRAWGSKDEEQFRVLHAEVLSEATATRAFTSRGPGHVQTLFYPPFLEHYRVNVGEWHAHVENEDAPDHVFDSYAQFCDNAYEVKDTKLSFPRQSFEDLRTELECMRQSNSCLVAHRSGMAFAALPLETTFLVLDSHVSRAGEVTADALLEWVRFGVPKGYSLYFWSTSASRDRL